LDFFVDIEAILITPYLHTSGLLILNNWIGAVATATATAAIAATATIAPTTAMHSQRYNAAMRSAEHRHP
jgi:uncharacterized membrane protein YhaH (DUF805 family)